jgi:hypothetical protein
MKFQKEVLINTGNYENVKIGVSDADSFEEIDFFIDREIKRIGIDRQIKTIKP